MALALASAGVVALPALLNAGALSIGQPGRTGSVLWRPVASPDELERVMEELPNKPFLVGEEGVPARLGYAPSTPTSW